MNIVSLGGSGASRSMFEIVRGLKDIKLLGFLDNRINKDSVIDGYKCLGGFSESYCFKRLGYKFITGIGSPNSFRTKSQKIISYNLVEEDFLKVISPNCIIETNQNLLKSGCLIFDYVFLGYEVKVGFLSLINTKTYIGHETVIGDYCIIGPNSTICGNVNIKSSTYIGAGSVVKDHINICNDVLIGCGSVVTKDIDKPGIYAGVPARFMKSFD